MIIARAPLRISFVGGGTDLAGFYHYYPGRVISATIDKFVYIVINHTPLIDKISARYSLSETVSHPSELQHTRIKAALTNLSINKNIEIGSFASLPAKTGLGSSSSFTAALLKGLYAFRGRKLGKPEIAEAACDLEIKQLQEPIGKQDQYAAAFGGFNIFQFNTDGTVDMEPILLDFKKQSLFRDHLLLFFTGITRSASSVLTEQSAKIVDHMEIYKKMSGSVLEFRDKLMAEDFRGLAAMLHEGWLQKKTLASNVSNNVVDTLYQAGLSAGAWGGKLLGAGAGGCLLFMAPPAAQEEVRHALKNSAREHNLPDFIEISFNFTYSGTDILFNNLNPQLV